MSKKRICFVQACWHKEIVDQLKDAFVARINQLLPEDPEIEFWEVPGSLEIPLQIKLCSENGSYDAFVVAGLIVNGGIYRHDFVANHVLDAVMRMQLSTGIPIIYAVLTPHHFHGEVHEKFFYEHFKIKGEEAADACAKTLENVAKVKHR